MCKTQASLLFPGRRQEEGTWDMMAPAEEGIMSEEINIRNISVLCGNCNTYQTLTSFRRREACKRRRFPH